MRTFIAIIILIILPASFRAQNESRKEFTGKLTMQYEQEKFAHDFYASMYDHWKLLAFKNLTKCEEMHMKVINGLLNEYSDQYAYNNPGKGKFNSTGLNGAFKETIAKGNLSENDALAAAGAVEERGIETMDLLLEYPEGQLHKECIENLKQNCIDHLNLLVCHLRHRGVEYMPVTLSVVKYINCAIFFKG